MLLSGRLLSFDNFLRISELRSSDSVVSVLAGLPRFDGMCVSKTRLWKARHYLCFGLEHIADLGSRTAEGWISNPAKISSSVGGGSIAFSAWRSSISDNRSSSLVRSEFRMEVASASVELILKSTSNIGARSG